MPDDLRTVPIPALDPIAFAVMKNAMDSIVDEIAYTVLRTVRSEIVKDVMDYSAAICDAHGGMVAQAKTIAQHLGATPEAMVSVQARWAGRLRPGDAVIMNDPYSGGMHLPDILMFHPVFAGDGILAWVVVICHHTDVGGRVPGSNAADSTETFQEGLRLPPLLLLYRDGAMDETLAAVIALNVRVPDRVLGDLRAQYAACLVGARELGRLAQRHGAAALRGHMDALLDYAERMTRAETATWPRGTFRFTDHIDSDGLSDAPVPLSVAITVGDDGLDVDWTGSSPQMRVAIDATLSFTKSNTFLSVCCALRGDIPSNLLSADCRIAAAGPRPRQYRRTCLPAVHCLA